jgi:hypothetical protein
VEHLPEEISRFLRTGKGDFEELALALFQYQFEKNSPYQAFCQAQGKTPEQISRWEEIPAVPIHAFKSKELVTFPVAQAAAVFHSSATTSGTPSRHFIRDLRYYEASIKTGFEGNIIDRAHTAYDCGASALLRDCGSAGSGAPLQITFLILIPSPAEAPHSSLSWMMEVLRGRWGTPCSEYMVRKGRLDEPRLAQVLAKSQSSKEKVMVLGTTLAFLAFFDYCAKTGQRFQLPESSRLMDTGGMKTSRLEITRPTFVDDVRTYLGIPEMDCINEYGMCELSSQFYGQGRTSFLQGPPWVRSRILDPVTGESAVPGQPGLLCHYDLANMDSVMAIQTEDIGLSGKGSDTLEQYVAPKCQTPHNALAGFVLLGRAPEAELKGCSLNAEAFLR